MTTSDNSESVEVDDKRKPNSLEDGDTVATQRRGEIDSLAVESRLEVFLSRPRVQISSNGSQLYCLCDDKINCVSTDNGRITDRMHTPDDAPLTFSVSRDSKLLVSAHVSGLLRLWKCTDTRTDGAMLKGVEKESAVAVMTWKSLHRGPVADLVFDPSTGSLVASGGVDGNIRVWDINHGHCTHSLRDYSVTGVVSALAFFQPSADEVMLIASGDGGTIVGWSLTSSSVSSRLSGHFSKVTSLCVLDSRSQLVSAARDKVIMLWDIRKQCLLKTIPVYESCEDAAVYYLGRGECGTALLASAGEAGRLRLWNLETGRCVYSGSNGGGHGSSGMPISQIHVAHDVGQVAAVTHQCNVLIFKLPTVEQSENMSQATENTLILHRQLAGNCGQVLDAVFCGVQSAEHTEETHLAVACSASADIQLYCVASFHCQLVSGHTDFVLALAASSSDRRLFASTAKDGTVRVWKLQMVAGEDRSDAVEVLCLAVGSGHTAAVTAVSWSRLSSRLLVTGAEDRCVKVWRTPSSVSAEVSEPKYEAVEVSLACIFSHIGHQKTVNAVCVSPNDRILAATSQDRTCTLYRGDGGGTEWSAALVLRGHSRGVWHAAFSPVDQVLATASADTTVRLWSVTDGSCLRTFSGHDASVLRVMFVGGVGKQLMTSSADGLVKLWTVRSGECTRTYAEHTGKVWALTSTCSQCLFVSGGDSENDVSLVVWRDSTGARRQQATATAARRLLHQQKLDNLLEQGQLLPALRLAINLERPRTCLEILIRLRRGGDEEDSSRSDRESRLDEVLKQLRDDQLSTLLDFVADWNTNSRYCLHAQQLINRLLRQRTPAQWRQLPGHRQLLEQLVPYTERHIQRLQQLQRSVAFLDYTAACIKVIPGGDGDRDVDETKLERRSAHLSVMVKDTQSDEEMKLDRMEQQNDGTIRDEREEMKTDCCGNVHRISCENGDCSTETQLNTSKGNKKPSAMEVDAATLTENSVTDRETATGNPISQVKELAGAKSRGRESARMKKKNGISLRRSSSNNKRKIGV